MNENRSEWLTPEEASALLPFGNADWVREQLRTGRLEGFKVAGRWMTTVDFVKAMVAGGSNSQTRRRKQRRVA